MLALRSNISFERKVEQIKGDIAYTDDQGNIIGFGKSHSNLDYLILPILIRLNAGKKILFFANLGPYFGLLLQTKTILKIPDQPIRKFDDKDGQIDIGIAAGIGIAIPVFKKFMLTIEARNNIALLPIMKGGKAKTNATNILFGFAYCIPNNQKN
jgi:hypothetical protein